MRLHRLLVEIDLHLQDLAAIGRRHRRALDRGELRPDEVLPEIEQLHLRQRLARQRKLQDRHARCVVAQHVGRRDAGRQQLQHGLRRRRHLRHGGGNIDFLLEEDLDHAIAAERLRLDMLDVADLGGQGAFIIVDDAARHVVRQQPVIGPDDADHRNIDVRKDIGRREQRRAYAEKRDQQRENDESVRAPERNLDDPHAAIPPKDTWLPACGNLRGRMHVAIPAMQPCSINSRPLGSVHRSKNVS